MGVRVFGGEGRGGGEEFGEEGGHGRGEVERGGGLGGQGGKPGMGGLWGCF